MKNYFILTFWSVLFLMSCSKVSESLVSDHNEYEDLFEEIDIPGAVPLTLANGFTVYQADSLYYIQDIFLTKEQVEILGSVETRGAVMHSLSHKWPDGIVKWAYESGYSSLASTRTAISTITSTIKTLKFE